MIRLGVEAPAEAGAREILLDRAMGPNRKMKASELVREGRRPAAGLSLVARDRAAIVGSVRLWHVDAGGVKALLLGPLAVDPARQGEGIGSRLMRLALDKARRAGHGAVILVGDPEYYARFGFKASLASGLTMPGAVEARRFVALELVPGALAGASGAVIATGARIRTPSFEHAAERIAA